MGRNRHNLYLKRFGKLQVVGLNNSGTLWICKCDCGGTKETTSQRLKDGNVQSCGCLKRGPKSTHGKYHTPEYKVWASMKNRCNDDTHWASRNYSDRGISVCERWKEFENFYEDMGDRPGDNYQLDRINNDKGYSPDNCQWITQQDNLRKKEQVTKVSINNREYTLKEISKEFNLTYQSVYQRYLKGLRGKDLIKPQSKRGRKKKIREGIGFWFLTPNHPNYGIN